MSKTAKEYRMIQLIHYSRVFLLYNQHLGVISSFMFGMKVTANKSF